MELKHFQKSVLNSLRRYAEKYASLGDAKLAYDSYLEDEGLHAGSDGIAYYLDSIGGVPRTCLKVPTGGGKTFIGVNAIKTILDELPGKTRSVVWLVPRTQILSQTIRQFRDPSHFTRLTLNRDFNGRVIVLSKEDGLDGRGFNASTIDEQLTVFVLSYDSFKKKRGEDKPVSFRENPSLTSVIEKQHELGTAFSVEGADDTALISAIAGLNPVVVVDESHHATSSLSVEMLKNLNPRFVLELTATPSDTTNVIAVVSAAELKRENMVKLPVIVYRRGSKPKVLEDAIALRARLEELAKVNEARTGDYIRPIVLLQAERRGEDDASTYERIRDSLVSSGIPRNQIAIRTGEVDELGDTDLMSRSCEIRFVITVDALAEGWDCPFAYVLATVANKNSHVSVEQVVGRILRQPYVRRADVRNLNTSYVLTSSEDFFATLDDVVRGLNGSGFSDEDVTAEPGGGQLGFPVSDTADDDGGSNGTDCDPVAGNAGSGDASPGSPGGPGNEGGSGDDTGFGGSGFNHDTPDENPHDGSVEDILDSAADAESHFAGSLNPASGSNNDPDDQGSGLGGGSNVHKIDPAFVDSLDGLRLPQYAYLSDGGQFLTDDWIPFDNAFLLEDFSLKSYGIDEVDVDVKGDDDVREVDVNEKGEYKISKLSAEQQQELRDVFDSLSEEAKRVSVRESIYAHYSSRFKNKYGEGELRAYIRRVVESLKFDQLDGAFDNSGTLARNIKNVIDAKASAFCCAKFKKYMGVGTIRLDEEAYSFPEQITLKRPLASYNKTLYDAEEGDVNDLERSMVDALSNAPGILWWHRIVERKHGEFCINGWINHYPDFVAMSNSGMVLIVETKGAHLGGLAETAAKLELGSRWADQAGDRYRYFMVFDKNPIDGAYDVSEFTGSILPSIK